MSPSDALHTSRLPTTSTVSEVYEYDWVARVRRLPSSKCALPTRELAATPVGRRDGRDVREMAPTLRAAATIPQIRALHICAQSQGSGRRLPLGVWLTL